MTIEEIKKQLETGECWVMRTEEGDEWCGRVPGEPFRVTMVKLGNALDEDGTQHAPDYLAPATYKRLTLKPEELEVGDEVKLGETWFSHEGVYSNNDLQLYADAQDEWVSINPRLLGIMYPNGLSVKRKIEVKKEPEKPEPETETTGAPSRVITLDVPKGECLMIGSSYGGKTVIHKAEHGPVTVRVEVRDDKEDED